MPVRPPALPPRAHAAGRGPCPRAAAGVGVLAGAALLAGCAPAVSVDAAPFAHDPVCARVVLALPATLADAERVDTTSQGTAAWTHDGPADAVVLRCGVEPLPPTTEQCVTATDERGRSVDWVAVPGDEESGRPWTFTTYGREPAVEVVVPTSVTSERSTSFLVDLGEAVGHTHATRQCL